MLHAGAVIQRLVGDQKLQSSMQHIRLDGKWIMQQANIFGVHCQLKKPKESSKKEFQQNYVVNFDSEIKITRKVVNSILSRKFSDLDRALNIMKSLFSTSVTKET